MFSRLAIPALALSLAVGCSEYEFDPSTGNNDLGDDTADVITDSGLEDGEYRDWYVVPERVDIVVFGDTSGSMEPELLTMSDNVRSFVDRLSVAGVDWQLISVTGPNGCNTSGILTATTANYEQSFETGILVPGGDEVDEWGLANMMAAVQATGSGQCNEGLLRDDALFYGIFVSDEDDNSPGWEQGGEYWKPYVDGIVAAKGGRADMVKLSAVGGPVPGGCDGAEPANGYYEAVTSTEGQFISICDAWADQVPVLADSPAAQTHFDVTHEPIVDTIEIHIDDRLADHGWHYNPDNMQIVFTQDPPLAGQLVSIVYSSYDL